MIRKEAWSFYKTISCVRLCWELGKPTGPEGLQLRVPSPEQNEIGNLLPRNQRQRRTCYALCHILYTVSAAHTSISSPEHVPRAACPALLEPLRRRAGTSERRGRQS